MNKVDLLRTALDSLRHHKLRSGLTSLGIIVGTSATIAMLAVGAGARDQVAAQVRSLGSNLLIVVSGNASQSGAKQGTGAMPSITDEDAAAIGREVGAVQAVSSLISARVQIVADASNWQTTILTVDPGYLEVRDWEIAAGRSFEPEESLRGAQVALLGQTVARQLFQDEDPVDRTVRIRNVPFKVIGVLAKKGQSTSGQDQDDSIIVPLDAGRRLLGVNRAKSRAVAAILVKVRDGQSMDNTQEEIEFLLRQRHRLVALQDDDFSVRNLTGAASAKEAAARTLSVLLASVALVSLVTGGIGILNIMLVSVKERTREIGIRLAVGARRRDILWQFLVEAIALSVLGGLVGVIVGIASSSIIAGVAGWDLIVDPASIVFVVMSSIALGIFFGWYPALSASRLNPIEAIRSH